MRPLKPTPAVKVIPGVMHHWLRSLCVQSNRGYCFGPDCSKSQYIIWRTCNGTVSCSEDGQITQRFHSISDNIIVIFIIKTTFNETLLACHFKMCAFYIARCTIQSLKSRGIDFCINGLRTCGLLKNVDIMFLYLLTCFLRVTVSLLCRSQARTISSPFANQIVINWNIYLWFSLWSA